jgi:hypothetical protein
MSLVFLPWSRRSNVDVPNSRITKLRIVRRKQRERVHLPDSFAA